MHSPDWHQQDDAKISFRSPSLVHRFCARSEVSVVGVRSSGLKVSCFVLISMGNGHCGNGVMCGVVRSCTHGLKFLVFCRGTKMANYCS
jgi:hypothetical protein